MGCKVGESIIIWNSTKHTTEVMSREIYQYLCNKRNMPRTYFENEVKSVIEKGPPTQEELKYLKCGCLNQSEIKGRCVIGACVVVSVDGWSVRINVPQGTPQLKVGTPTDRGLWPEPKTPLPILDVCTSVDFTYDQNTHQITTHLYGTCMWAFEIWHPTWTSTAGVNPAGMLMSQGCHCGGGAITPINFAGYYTLKYSCGLSCLVSQPSQSQSQFLVHTKTIYCPYP